MWSRALVGFRGLGNPESATCAKRKQPRMITSQIVSVGSWVDPTSRNPPDQDHRGTLALYSNGDVRIRTLYYRDMILRFCHFFMWSRALVGFRGTNSLQSKTCTKRG